ncbi:hypothetical protein AYI68_g5283 [Smittium mucronatum]|uniref:Uncharacterized protein n=1 Tax=Smittium mucronatum TaxID=133383 RepID=A0A1R0GUP4_9FUNG|nr:hypothetical protein AYI68_g5283 [Smittium mucronatum]
MQWEGRHCTELILFLEFGNNLSTHIQPSKNQTENNKAHSYPLLHPPKYFQSTFITPKQTIVQHTPPLS